jgi:DNA-binding MarR family transcriptional regulator
MDVAPHLQQLQPTLWRTCRVLANRTRLEILRFLLEKPGQTVSAVAARFNITLPLASQYLRGLEARGLLAVRRMGRRVAYRPMPSNKSGPAEGIPLALRLVFQRESDSVERIFFLATAFTHLRRIAVFRVLLQKPRIAAARIQAETRISRASLGRHLGKLERRGFVRRDKGAYTVVEPRDPLRRELIRLAGVSARGPAERLNG